MRASDALITYLKRREAFAEKPYRDSAGRLTVGYGHVLTAGERAMRTLVMVDMAHADALLRQDVSTRALWLAAVNSNLAQPLNQQQFDACLSLAFNIGLTAFENSTLLKMLRAGNFAGAANQFERWIYATDPKTGKKIALRGLVSRRRGDRAIFERGDYSQ